MKIISHFSSIFLFFPSFFFCMIWTWNSKNAKRYHCQQHLYCVCQVGELTSQSFQIWNSWHNDRSVWILCSWISHTVMLWELVYFIEEIFLLNKWPCGFFFFFLNEVTCYYSIFKGCNLNPIIKIVFIICILNWLQPMYDSMWKCEKCSVTWLGPWNCSVTYNCYFVSLNLQILPWF